MPELEIVTLDYFTHTYCFIIKFKTKNLSLVGFKNLLKTYVWDIKCIFEMQNKPEKSFKGGLKDVYVNFLPNVKAARRLSLRVICSSMLALLGAGVEWSLCRGEIQIGLV